MLTVKERPSDAFKLKNLSKTDKQRWMQAMDVTIKG